MVVVPGEVPESLWISEFELNFKIPSCLYCGYLYITNANGHIKKLTSILLFPTDISVTRSWEQENAQTQADESSHSAPQQTAWGISETESDLTYGEVEQRLDLLQEQLNRYKQCQGKEDINQALRWV